MSRPDAMPPDPAPKQSRPEQASHSGILAVVLAYAVLAALWVLLSDRVVEWLFSDPAQITLASTFKGLLFVTVTSFLLYGLMRRMAGPAPIMTPTASPAGTLRPTLPFLLLAAAILSLTAGGIGQIFIQQRDKEVARLQVIADLKVRQIADWLQERQGDAEFVQTSQIAAANYRRWREAGDLASRDQLQARLEQLRHSRGFAAVLLLDERGERLWGSARAPLEIAQPLRDAARQAAVDHQVHRAGPYLGVAGTPRLDFVAPLTAAGAHPPLVVLHTNPADWLYRTLQTWPAPSASGETLLFRRDGDHILFLNELRHRKDTAVKLRVPLARKKLPAAQVLRGETSSGGLVEGEDYRGVAVMGVAHAIPGTDWFLVAKLDRAELYGEAVRNAIWIGLAGLLALFMAAAGFYLLRQRQQLALTASVHQSQAERLRALNLLAALADSSDDAIFAKDLEGRYILFNRAASNFVGKPAGDVLGHDDRTILPSAQAEMLMDIGRQVIADNRIHTQEEVLDTPEGKRVFLATRGPLRDADGKVIGIFGISRDITKRKQAELALRESERRFHDIVNASADWIWEVNAEGCYTYASESVQNLLGYTPSEIIGKSAFDLMPPEEAIRLRALFAGLSAQRAPFRDLDNINRHRDGSLRHVQSNGMPILDDDGKLLGYRGLDRDITERKQAELELRESEARFRALFDTAAVAIMIHDRDSGAIIEANQRAIEYYGFETLEELQQNKFWLEPPYSLEDAIAIIHKAANEGPQRFEWKNRDLHGRVFWEDISLNRVTLNGIERVLSITTDITARKAAKETLLRQAEKLRQHNAELERFNRATIGRELDMIALKQQVNALSRQLGQEPPYPLAFLDAPSAQPKEGEAQ